MVTVTTVTAATKLPVITAYQHSPNTVTSVKTPLPTATTISTAHTRSFTVTTANMVTVTPVTAATKLPSITAYQHSPIAANMVTTVSSTIPIDTQVISDVTSNEQTDR